MRVLALDTTTQAGSTALVDDVRVIAERRGDPTRTHAERLPDEIMTLLAACRSEEHTSELQSRSDIVCRLLLEKKKKDVNSHTVLDGIITTIMATIQRINIIGSREGSRNRRRLKANQTGKKFRVGIKSNISTNRNNLISGVDRCIHLNAMKKTTITSINRQTIKI